MKTSIRNIGMLRQWLNEDRITDPEKMVTNEEIVYWLEINKCTCTADKESNLTIDKACYWHGK